MADENSEPSDSENKKDETARARHTPQHANAKHDRQPVKEEPAGAAASGASEAGKPAGTGPHHKLWRWITSHKKIAIPAAVVLLVAILAAIPFTRYAIAGLFLKQNFSVLVTDSQTHKPVTSALVTLQGKQVGTDNKGVATLHVKVGNAKVSVSKKYYTSATKDVLVPIGKQKQPAGISLAATGRQVPVTVTNKISGKPVANIHIVAQGTEAKTDAKGEAVLVVPADKDAVDATLSGSGYNEAKVSVKVTASVDPANTFQVTPGGKLYFLSDASGALDVVKTNLDGTGRQTVLSGTGKEDKPSTVLLASRDWKYVALLSKRDGGQYAKLFLIDTSNDQVTTMDEGNAAFAPYGWSGDRFIYTVNRANQDAWAPKAQALKSYDAAGKKITTLDETNAEGDANSYAYQTYEAVYVFNQDVVYTKTWSAGGNYIYNPQARLNGKQDSFNTIKSDGNGQKTLKGYDLSGSHYSSLQTRPGGFNEVYIRWQENTNNPAQYEEYADGKIVANTDETDDVFYNKPYLTYIVSPSGDKTFWTDYRDGKNVFFVGDGNGENGKQLAGSSDDYAAYGWFTDDYLLVTKKNSEMYIMPAAGLPGGVTSALKVSDYFKPNYLLRGYGYGYGG